MAALTHLRLHVEACIDFPEEEIDPADRAAQGASLAAIRADLARLVPAFGSAGDHLDVTVPATPNDSMLGNFSVVLEVRSTLPPPNEARASSTKRS